MRYGAVVFVGAMTGCVLFVDVPEEVYSRCRFDGEDTTCGACLRASCQPEINACCTGTCDSALVDRCATTVAGACDQLRAAPAFATCMKTCAVCR